MNLSNRFLILIAGIWLMVFAACSSSSSSIRYQESDQTGKTTQDNTYRYSSNSSDDSSFIYEGEEVPEFQDPSDLPEDEARIDLSSVLKNIDKKSSDGETVLSSQKEIMIMEIIKYMNTPYKYGGNSLNGIDCSAFTQNVYQNSWMIPLNRSARDQFIQGTPVNDRSDLKFGDLVFFNTRRRVKPGHVGIYIGDNLFAHASSKLGVTVSSLEYDYYNKRYMGARRIKEEGTDK